MRPALVASLLAGAAVLGYLALRPNVAPAAEPSSGAEARESGPRRIGGEEARRLVAAGATLLDVRTPGEYADGHVDGALSVPVQELEGRIAELPRDRPVVVYCLSGGRSAAASRMLAAAGYEAYDLGPMSAW